MDDIFNECLVKRRNGPKQLLYKALIGLGGVLIMAVSFVFIGMPFSIVIVLGVGVGLFFSYKEFDVEYEYALTNNELDFDKITSRERRKHMITVDVKQLETFAPVPGEQVRPDACSKANKVFDFTGSARSKKRWYCLYNGENGKTVIIFEPTEKMIEGIQSYLPRYMKSQQ